MRSSGSSRVERVVLDTSAYSHMRTNHTGVISWLSAADRVYVPVIVLGELAAAFRRGRRELENRQTLDDFLAEPFVSTLLVTPGVARRYGQVFASLRSAGTPIPVNDIWIAATVLDSGAHLLTFDSDFARVTELERTILSAES